MVRSMFGSGDPVRDDVTMTEHEMTEHEMTEHEAPAVVWLSPLLSRPRSCGG